MYRNCDERAQIVETIPNLITWNLQVIMFVMIHMCCFKLVLYKLNLEQKTDISYYKTISNVDEDVKCLSCNCSSKLFIYRHLKAKQDVQSFTTNSFL